MARVPRNLLLGEGSLFHVTWQCHNRSWLLNHRWAKELLYDLLLRFKDKYGMVFYSYIIMDNHLHLSGTVHDLAKFSAYFRIVHSLFAKRINQRLKRCGQVVRDRFKSPQLQDEKSLIREMIYHDLNEVRAGKSKDPRRNEFSSYAHYALGKPDPLVTEPDFYLNLGESPKKRQTAYQAMVLEILISAPRKKDGRYTQEFYIGDPLWVEQRYEELKVLRRQLDPRTPLSNITLSG